jgi:hypothetical protein
MWTFVRALRNHTSFSDGVACDAGKQPVLFASTAAVPSIGALLFAWLAANGGVAGSWRLIGPH